MEQEVKECGHPANAMISYMEDGVHYHACTACGEIWEIEGSCREK